MPDWLARRAASRRIDSVAATTWWVVAGSLCSQNAAQADAERMRTKAARLSKTSLGAPRVSARESWIVMHNPMSNYMLVTLGRSAEITVLTRETATEAAGRSEAGSPSWTCLRSPGSLRWPTDAETCESPGSRPSRPALRRVLGLALRGSRLSSRTAPEEAVSIGHRRKAVNPVRRRLGGVGRCCGPRPGNSAAERCTCLVGRHGEC